MKSLKLNKNILKATDKLGYETPTEIQTKAVPAMIEGRDVIGLSETGSGKTAAFSLPALEILDFSQNTPQMLVVAPTRELAMQIAAEIKELSRFMDDVYITTLFGGEPYHKQIRDLKRANIVVGTPGRIEDHIKRRTLIMNHLKLIVLDEADEMLNMGFYDDIIRILDKAPKQKQMALFSATMPKEILELSKRFLSNPVTINSISKKTSPSQIEQYFYYIKQAQKDNALLLLLKYYNPTQSIIFTNTKRKADELATLLRTRQLNVNALHGDLPQNTRTQILKDFREGKLKYLVATDVAARGIDVDDVDLVVNYDLPQSNEYYIHRIGRTGRAGRSGVSFSLATHRFHLRQINDIKRLTNSNIIERALPTKASLEKELIDKEVSSIIQNIDQELHPLAEELIDTLIKETGGQLNDIGLSYLIANTLIKELVKDYDLDSLDNMTPSRKGQDVKVRVAMGRKQSIKPKALSQAIVREINVKARDVGDIKINSNYTIVMLNEDHAKQLLKKGSVKMNKRNIKVSNA